MKNFILFCALLCLLCAASSVHAKKRPQVAVVVAMDYEFAPYNTTMNLKRITPDKRFSENLPYEIYKRDNYRGIDYRFVTFGYNKFVMANYPRIVRNPGPEPATAATLVLLNDFKPDLIVSAGTAGKSSPPHLQQTFSFSALHHPQQQQPSLSQQQGGWSNQFHVGDIGVCANGKTFNYYDRRIEFHPAYVEYGYGFYPCAQLPQSVLTANNIHLAQVATGASYAPSPTDAEILARYNVDMVEMEGAAVADLARWFDIPFFAVKIVSNSYVYTGETEPADLNQRTATTTVKLVEAYFQHNH